MVGRGGKGRGRVWWSVEKAGGGLPGGTPKRRCFATGRVGAATRQPCQHPGMPQAARGSVRQSVRLPYSPSITANTLIPNEFGSSATTVNTRTKGRTALLRTRAPPIHGGLMVPLPSFRMSPAHAVRSGHTAPDGRTIPQRLAVRRSRRDGGPVSAGHTPSPSPYVIPRPGVCSGVVARSLPTVGCVHAAHEPAATSSSFRVPPH